MDQAKTLVRSVVRSFYDTEHVIVIDSIITHSAVTLEDLKQVFAAGGRAPKDIAKYLGRLREAGLVSTYARQETKPGAQKSSTVEYWWTDYHRAIDATKYRLHMLQDHLSHLGKSTTEKKEYFCPECGSEWTQMEALDNPDPEHRGSGFLCKVCNNPLEFRPDNSTNGGTENDNIVSQFNKQLGHILALVESIDNLTVPASTPESALENIKPVPRQKEVGVIDTEPLEHLMTQVKPTSVKGLAQQAEKVEIVLTTDSENNAAVQAAEAERKAKIAAQNQLPEWHTKSTVSGDPTRAATNQAAREADAHGALRVQNGEKKASINTAAIDDFFANLEAQQGASGNEGQNQDEEEEEESDEDEFEEVISPVLKRPRLDDGIAQSSDSSAFAPTATAAPVQVAEDEDDSEEGEFETVV
jgi:transcription initiation factor TFIIE subunit alpha